MLSPAPIRGGYLKGGALLAAYGTRRPTRDVDLLATDLHIQADTVLAVVQDIAALPRDDGLVFDPASATAHPIRDEDEYSGVRVSMTATLGRARLAFHVDVNVGDPVWPAPSAVAVPGLLGGDVELLGYPLPTVYAEKIVTALQRGTANTRWCDFADIYLLRAQQDVDGSDLTTALTKVADHRGVTLMPLSDPRRLRTDRPDPLPRLGPTPRPHRPPATTVRRPARRRPPTCRPRAVRRRHWPALGPRRTRLDVTVSGPASHRRHIAFQPR